MKKIVFTCIAAGLIISLMTGCESKEEKEQAKQAELFKQEQVQLAAKKAAEEAENKKKVAKKKAVEEARLAKAAEEENLSTMNKMGVSMEEGRLIIDTNKAKEFFVGLQKRLDDTSREIDKELQEGNLTITIPAGVEVTNQKVSIDINKTKNFLDSWGERMADFAKEFDTMTQILHSDTQTQGEEK